jgi:hypothetical protein
MIYEIKNQALLVDTKNKLWCVRSRSEPTVVEP